ncbi:hypothetical protein DMR09_02665 [Klebsiella variicola]|nr:hypothetical protein DMR09_02665 [Klebsiella variicola]
MPASGTKQTAPECRVSGMEAPDEVTCVCGVKWRRRPAQPAAVLTGSASPPPSLVSNSLW